MNLCAICGGVLDADDRENLCSDCLAVSYSSMRPGKRALLLSRGRATLVEEEKPCRLRFVIS